jgi:hypothetical protein
MATSSPATATAQAGSSSPAFRASTSRPSTPGDGAEGLALDGSTLYAALWVPGQVAAINAATLKQTTTYALPTGDNPYSIALQSGDVWVSYGTSMPGSAGIGDVSLPTGTFQPASAGSANWYQAPDLAADPADSGLLVAEQATDPVEAATYSTTTSPATQLAAPTYLGGLVTGPPACSIDAGLAVVPGGGEFLATCYSPPVVEVYSTTNLTTPAGYYSASFPAGGSIAVAIAPDGTIAEGTSQDVYLFQPDGTLLGTYPLAPQTYLARKGLAWSADGTLYAVVSTGNTGGPYSTGPLTGFAQLSSSITLTAPAAAPLAGAPFAIAGKLSFSAGAPPQGTPISISRDNPDGSTTSLGTVTTDSTGSHFSVTDIAPTASPMRRR